MRAHARRQALLLLLLVTTLFAITGAFASVEHAQDRTTESGSAAPTQTAGATFQTTKKAHDYGNVKEDLMCRACVALSSDYFDVVLPSLRARYGAYVEDGTAPRLYRERMVAELHESVDGLCGALKTRRAAARAETPISGSTKDLDEAVDIACPSTLETIDDALTDIALAYLLPNKFPAQEGDSTEAEAEGVVPEPDPQSTPAAAYVLPKAGSFCEARKLCLPFVHYHITSLAGSTGDAKPESLTQGDKEALESGLKKQRTVFAHGTDQPEAIPGAPADDGEDDPSLLHTLTDPETYKKLPERVPLGTVLSPTFWGWTAHYLFRDAAVQFHLRDRFVFVFGLAVLLFLVFTGAVYVLCRTRHGARGEARTHPAAAAGKGASSPAKTESARGVSGTRRRAPARKEA